MNWQERSEKAEAELAKAREREAKQKPVAMVDAGDDGYFAEILPDCSVSVGEMLYAFPPLNIDPELWKPSFDQWWNAHGQYLRAGGGQYEKTFGYHAWEAAAALYAATAPAVAAPAVLDNNWKRFTDDDLAEIHQLSYELGGTDSGEYLLDGDHLDQIVVKCASLFYAFPVKAAPAPAVSEEWREVLSGLLAIAEKKGKKQGSPNHSHLRPGIWDDDNGPVLSGKPCAECAMYDKARALLQSAEVRHD